MCLFGLGELALVLLEFHAGQVSVAVFFQLDGVGAFGIFDTFLLDVHLAEKDGQAAADAADVEDDVLTFFLEIEAVGFDSQFC